MYGYAEVFQEYVCFAIGELVDKENLGVKCFGIGALTAEAHTHPDVHCA